MEIFHIELCSSPHRIPRAIFLNDGAFIQMTAVEMIANYTYLSLFPFNSLEKSATRNVSIYTSKMCVFFSTFEK